MDLDVLGEYAGPTPHVWQQDAYNEWWDRDHLGIVEAVTGTGKSVLGALAIAKTLRNGGRAVVAVPSLILLEQWTDVLNKYVPNAIVRQHGNGIRVTDSTRVDVIIATYETLRRNPLSLHGLWLLLIDEVHMVGAEKAMEILQPEFERRLGLTATLDRRDDGVERYIEPYFAGSDGVSRIFNYDFAQAKHDGVISPFKIAFAGVNLSVSEKARYERLTDEMWKAQSTLVATYKFPEKWDEFFAMAISISESGEYHGQLTELCRSYVKNWAERKKVLAEAEAKFEILGRLADYSSDFPPTVIFAQTVEATKAALEEFGRKIRVEMLSGETKLQERKQIIRDFENGRVKVIGGPQVLDQGLDVPGAEIGIVVAASKTRRQMIQRMGRIVRKKQEGVMAKFLIFYVFGTPEDPQVGGQDAFLEIVTDPAESVEYFDLASVENLADFLSN
jgi:superfamily II DNA or RNA helicase